MSHGTPRDAPWEHPDWYDLHHLLDAGCGTGKLAALVARGYPRLGRVTLLEPNEPKLERAVARLRELLPKARIDAVKSELGERTGLALPPAGVGIVGSVLMPIMELRGGTLAGGLAWLRAALGDLHGLVRSGGWLYDVETLAAPWARRGLDDSVRRLTLPELTDELARAGFEATECVYRFRDRVIVKARRAR